ncbi:MAG: hypothetical protein F4227_03235 [Gammaproteobacteria bacterium]|nr:hypothetical protein [Gammaproteobacteria bacterium]MYF02005.1 hypothetical protein [Gammaproteobacteria bacterium]MYI77539.1 hypothetical protein [Gammaproteobacteria bacterium]
MDELIEQIADALQTRSTLPEFPESLTVAEAYEIQNRVVAKFEDDSIIGLKAGLTSAGSQESIGVPHPILGRLFASGRLFSGTTLPIIPDRFLECEIGICLDESGDPSSVCPVIELPRIAFGLSAEVTGPNLIACNVAADSYILGDCVESPTSFDDRSVELKRDGKTLYQAKLTEPLGGPSESLAWMINESQSRRFSIPNEALMLTGACGGIHPASPGSYVADYGSLGSVEFEITDD